MLEIKKLHINPQTTYAMPSIILSNISWIGLFVDISILLLLPLRVIVQASP
jgi:hypothetical protein